MITLPHGARIWLACGVTDMRRGFDGLAALVQTQFAGDLYGGHLFCVPGKAWQSLENFVVERRRTEPVREAS